MSRTFALALLVLGLLAAAAGPAAPATGSDYLRSRLTRSGGIVESRLLDAVGQPHPVVGDGAHRVRPPAMADAG